MSSLRKRCGATSTPTPWVRSRSFTYDAAAPAHRSYGSFGRTSDFQDPEVVLGYTGHEHDLELGLINMNARMYDPISARFLTPDPMMSQPYGTGVNPYAYAGNNPIDRTDPTGMYWEKDRDVPYAIGAFFGLFAVGGVATAGGGGSGSAMGAAGPGFAALDTYANYLDNRAFTRRSYVGTQPASTATSSAQQVTPMPGSRTAGTDWAPGGATTLGQGEPVGPPLSDLLDEGTPEGLGLCDAGDCLAMRGARRPPRGAPIPGGGGPVLRPQPPQPPIPLPVPRLAPGRSWSSHRAMVQELGPAGPFHDYHHIVEQTPSNLARFGAQRVHNSSNVVRLERSLHWEINEFYGKVRPEITGSRTLTVREWVGRMSFENQQIFGNAILKGIAGF